VRYKPPYTVAEILRLRSEGKANSQIAQRFGVSRSRIQQIIAHEQRRTFSAQRSVAIRQELAACNGIDRKLPIDDLFCVLNLPPRAETVLRNHFGERGVDACSLLDMMDLLIPLVEGPADHYDHMPAYRVKWLGQILYADMIRALSAVDCGEALRTEWGDRKTHLREYLKATCGYYPYMLHGRNAALLDP
jgi:hypothetical protein